MQRQRFASSMKFMGFIMVNSPCLFLQVVGVSIVSTPLESSRFFTSLGFLNHNSSGRCSDKRFASSMKVMGIIMVNSPCRFLLFVDTSFEMRPLESSLAFTWLGLLIPNALQASARQNHTLPSFTITLSFPK